MSGVSVQQQIKTLEEQIASPETNDLMKGVLRQHLEFLKQHMGVLQAKPPIGAATASSGSFTIIGYFSPIGKGNPNPGERSVYTIERMLPFVDVVSTKSIKVSSDFSRLDIHGSNGKHLKTLHTTSRITISGFTPQVYKNPGWFCFDVTVRQGKKIDPNTGLPYVNMNFNKVTPWMGAPSYMALHDLYTKLYGGGNIKLEPIPVEWYPSQAAILTRALIIKQKDDAAAAAKKSSSSSSSSSHSTNDNEDDSTTDNGEVKIHHNRKAITELLKEKLSALQPGERTSISELICGSQGMMLSINGSGSYVVERDGKTITTMYSPPSFPDNLFKKDKTGKPKVADHREDYPFAMTLNFYGCQSITQITSQIPTNSSCDSSSSSTSQLPSISSSNSSETNNEESSTLCSDDINEEKQMTLYEGPKAVSTIIAFTGPIMPLLKAVGISNPLTAGTLLAKYLPVLPMTLAGSLNAGNTVTMETNQQNVDSDGSSSGDREFGLNFDCWNVYVDMVSFLRTRALPVTAEYASSYLKKFLDDELDKIRTMTVGSTSSSAPPSSKKGKEGLSSLFTRVINMFPKERATDDVLRYCADTNTLVDLSNERIIPICEKPHNCTEDGEMSEYDFFIIQNATEIRDVKDDFDDSLSTEPDQSIFDAYSSTSKQYYDRCMELVQEYRQNNIAQKITLPADIEFGELQTYLQNDDQLKSLGKKIGQFKQIFSNELSEFQKGNVFSTPHFRIPKDQKLIVSIYAMHKCLDIENPHVFKDPKYLKIQSSSLSAPSTPSSSSTIKEQQSSSSSSSSSTSNGSNIEPVEELSSTPPSQDLDNIIASSDIDHEGDSQQAEESQFKPTVVIKQQSRGAKRLNLSSASSSTSDSQSSTSTPTVKRQINAKSKN